MPPTMRRKRVAIIRNGASGLFEYRHFTSRGFAAPFSYCRSVMKISARNKIKGKILEVKKGATTAHVRLEIAPGQIITASITNEAVDELVLKAGGAAIAVVKASDVMIAVD
jgi:molybdopterin-binding protein